MTKEEMLEIEEGRRKMTAQEAIELIDNRMCFGRGKWSKYHMPVKDTYWIAGEMAIKALRAESCEDTVSRQAAIDAIGKVSDELYENIKKGATFPQRQWFDGMAQAQSILEDLPSAQPEIVRCKDCKYFELDHFEKVDGFPIPIIVAHEICMKWGERCKSSVDGWCFMAERRTND